MFLADLVQVLKISNFILQALVIGARNNCQNSVSYIPDRPSNCSTASLAIAGWYSNQIIFHYLRTRKNCHIFLRNRHFRPLKTRIGDSKFQEELSQNPHRLKLAHEIFLWDFCSSLWAWILISKHKTSLHCKEVCLWAQ